MFLSGTVSGKNDLNRLINVCDEYISEIKIDELGETKPTVQYSKIGNNILKVEISDTSEIEQQNRLLFIIIILLIIILGIIMFKWKSK